jgi:hypothetical protein
MSRSWELLEDAGGAHLTEAHWFRLARAEFEVLQPFLSPSREPLSEIPCDRSLRGFACAYSVMETGENRFVALCEEGRCERRELTRRDVVGWSWDTQKLGSALASLLVSPGTVAIVQKDPRILRFATVATERGSTCACVLVRGRDDLQTAQFLDQLRLEFDGRALIFTPTARYFGLNAEDRLRRHGWRHLVLDQLAVFRPTGLAALAGARDAIDAAVEALTGQPTIPTRIKVPEGCRWSEVIFKASRSDQFVFNVTIRGARYRVSAADLGLEDKRTKQGDRQWQLLRMFAKQGGRISLEKIKDRASEKRIKNRLSAALRKALGIAGDPIEYRRDENAWVTIFGIEGE